MVLSYNLRAKGFCQWNGLKSLGLDDIVPGAKISWCSYRYLIVYMKTNLKSYDGIHYFMRP